MLKQFTSTPQLTAPHSSKFIYCIRLIHFDSQIKSQRYVLCLAKWIRLSALSIHCRNANNMSLHTHIHIADISLHKCTRIICKYLPVAVQILIEPKCIKYFALLNRPSLFAMFESCLSGAECQTKMDLINFHRNSTRSRCQSFPYSIS